MHPSKTLIRAGILSAFALVSSSGMAAVIANYDFSTDSNTEGWSSLNVSSLTTSGGFITGTASSNDPQLLKNPESLTVGAGQTWDTVVFRVREFDDVSGKYIGSSGAPAFSAVGLVVQVNATIVSTGMTVVASGDDFYTVTANISGLADTTITNFRVDPIGGALSNSGSETNGNSFEVDFIRISDTAAVPEPSAALLGGLGMLALLRRRR